MSKPGSHNHVFRHAAACLAHPLSLLALGLLLLNDHVLRVRWPGWVTGKLGDFAWLFFAPLALAAALAWLIPPRIHHHRRWVVGLAFGLTGAVFALAKTWAPFHVGLVRLAGLLFGWPVGWQRDPTDLAALLSLASAAWLWRARPRAPAPSPRRAWLLLSSAALLTMANSIQPETGIVCLEVQEGQIYALSSRSIYRAAAGGTEWQAGAGDGAQSAPLWAQCRWSEWMPGSHDAPPAVSLWPDPADAMVVYRTTRGISIERSGDGGLTWTIEFTLQPDSEAMHSYYARRSSGDAAIADGPFDAVFDPATGNLILAMGHSGVLVRGPDGTYRWTAVGVHQHTQPGLGQVLFILFPGEVLLSLIWGGLGLMVLTPRRQPSPVRWLLTGGAAAAWALVMLALPPALEGFGYEGSLVMLLLGAAGLAMLPLVLYTLYRAGQAGRTPLLHAALVFVGASALFFLPFAAWAADLLPNYRLAQVIGLLLGGGWLAGHAWRGPYARGRAPGDAAT